MEGLSGSSWFSSLDLVSGYWQIPMDEASREKTGFATKSHGLLQFNVLPFGLTNAPASFQRAMDAMILGLSFSTALAYLDDILIHSSGTFEDHLTKLETGRTSRRVGRTRLYREREEIATLPEVHQISGTSSLTEGPAAVA